MASKVESQRGSTGLMKRISGMSSTDESSVFAPLYCTKALRSSLQKFVKMSS